MLPSMDDRVGEELGGYILEEPLGSGATGVVYGAHKGDKRVALKVLSPALANQDVLTRRFEREARVLRKLEHPGVVDIHAFGIEGDDAFIVMERLDGETLEARLNRERLTPALVLSVMRQVLAALSHAHEAGVVHRDLKPANIFLCEPSNSPINDEEGDGTPAPHVKVLDFGLAKFLSHDETNAEGTLTRRGRVVGTPAYMAPEQITGVAVDERVDLYAAAVVAYELIADRRPFTNEKRSTLLRAHLFDEVPRFEEVDERLSVDEKLEDVIRRALSKDPARRYASASAFLQALEPFTPEALGELPAVAKIRDRSAPASAVIAPEERDKAAQATLTAPRAPGAKREMWITLAVWLVGLACFGAAVGTMVYAAVVVR